jgi:acetate kinase
MNGLDAIVFTAGIGENSETIRKMVCENLDYLGIRIDLDKNKIRSKELREIQDDKSSVQILVIPTNEEIEIAKQSYALLN